MTDYYNGSESNDYYNYVGNDNLIAYGNGGDDFIYGNWGNDRLYGLTGNDTLWGYYGDDYIDGYGVVGYTYGEYDSLAGGYGADTFAIADEWGRTQYAADGYWSYGYSDGYATITDYSSSENDTIQLGSSDRWNYFSDSYYDYNSNGIADTSIYYGYNLIAVVSDTSSSAINYSYV